MIKPTQVQIEAKLEEWDAWYATLPPALKSKLSIADFRRLGDNFYRIFVLEKSRPSEINALKAEIERLRARIKELEDKDDATYFDRAVSEK
jgi:hypothetical protein